jgi:hypothetical protein
LQRDIPLTGRVVSHLVGDQGLVGKNVELAEA